MTFQWDVMVANPLLRTIIFLDVVAKKPMLIILIR